MKNKKCRVILNYLCNNVRTMFRKEITKNLEGEWKHDRYIKFADSVLNVTLHQKHTVP